LEGLEVSIQLFKSIGSIIDYRIEAEYFEKRFLHIDEAFEKIKSVQFFDVADYENGRPYSSEEFFDSYIIDGVKVAKIGDVTQKRLNVDWVWISRLEFQAQKGNNLVDDDILMTLTGDPPDVGKVNLFKINHLFSTWNQRVARIYLKAEQTLIYSQKTFFIVLCCSFCREQLERYAKGIRQRNLGIECIEKLQLPLFKREFQIILDNLVSQSFINLDNSKKSYTQAESLLLQNSGLQDFKHCAEAVNIKSFNESFIKSGRLDAEYYQKKFDELERQVMQTGDGVKLGTLLKLNKRGSQPTYIEDANGLPVLNSKHIRENKIDFSDNRKGDINETNAELVIRKNDVLINGTGVGTIGRCAVYMKDEPALPDNHITILRTNEIDPVFLAVMLNSPIGKMQVDKYFKGSSGQIELYPADINEFLVWKAPKELQMKIRASIEEAESLSQQSEHLLEVAKKAVEMAIEEGEEKAMEWITLNK
jgi:type I restriction enzyme M protein